MLIMARRLFYIAVVVVGVRARDDTHSPAPSPPPHTVADLGLDRATPEEVKKDRAALLGTSKILSFGPSLSGLPGHVGVSLGLGLPIPSTGHHHPRPPQGIIGPTLPGTERPHCAGRFNSYCPHHLNYPLDKVNNIIDRFYNDVTIIYNDLYKIPSRDVLYYDNSTLRHRRDGHFICESVVEYVRPGWAQNLRGEWVAIINTDTFPQTVRVDTCRYGGKRCEYLPPCYKSQCVQRYSYIRLLSVSPRHPTYRPIVDVFQIPSACACFVEDFTYY